MNKPENVKQGDIGWKQFSRAFFEGEINYGALNFDS
jgi:hypothetical protein